jgi:hypothetical protein
VKRSELTAKIAALRQEQFQSTDHATYLGWTPERLTEYNNRASLITELLTQLANCNGD